MTEMRTGNVRELWKISLPMMISFASLAVMLFVDRVFLAYYSTSALNASAQAGTLAWGFILGWMTLATMSEVFVSQYNGAEDHGKIGRPVWQMIWLCLASTLFFIPMAIWGSSIFYGGADTVQEREYFKYFLYGGPIYCLVPALGGFYIGRGKTQIMQWLALLGNAVNVALDPIFIFGIPHVIPEMGAVGATIATALGTLVQVIVLFACFLATKNNQQFTTHDYKIYPSLFIKSLKVGIPPAIFVAFEILGWALFYSMMSMVSPVHILVASVCQSILILFLFFGWGMEKGTIALAGNLIGSGNNYRVPTVLKSAFKLSTWYFFFTIIVLILIPDPLISWFSLENGMDLTSMGISLEELKDLIRTSLIFVCIYIFFENIRWSINGMLTAAGDTLFLLIAGSLAVWGIMLAPTYFFVVLPKAHVYYAFGIWILYSSAACLIVFLRFRFGAWKKINLLDNHELGRGKIPKDVGN